MQPLIIRELKVKNFKTLVDLSLQLRTRNVLIGPNMAGKSNILSVFRFLRRLVSPSIGVHGVGNAFADLGGFQEVVWGGGDSNLISIELTGNMPKSEQFLDESAWTYKIDIVGERRGGIIRVQDETLALTDAAGEHPLIERDPGSGKRIFRARSGEQISQIDDNSRSALEFELPNWEGNLLRMLFASFSFYQLSPFEMKRLNSTSAIGPLDERGGNLSSWLMMLQTRYRQESFDRIVAAAKDAFPELTDLLTHPTPQATVFLASSEAGIRSAVPVWQMSDGELCFLALLSLIYCPAEFAVPLYCIEEPENYLHPRLLEALVGLHNQRLMALETDRRPSQSFITTHSLLLVDKVNVEDLIVVEKRAGATVCTRPAERQELRVLLERSELGLGDLYYSGVLSATE